MRFVTLRGELVLSEKPLNDLSKVIQLACHGSIVFNARQVSLEAIARALQVDLAEAWDVAIRGISILTESDFHSRCYQWEETYDQYGLQNYEKHNWYIKFTIFDDGGLDKVEEVSFHPLKKLMVMPDGRRLEVTINESSWRLSK